MNRRWGAGLFAGGLLTGWVVRGDGVAATTAAPDAKAERQRREPSRKPVAHESKWHGLDERLLTQSHEERGVFSKNLTSGDGAARDRFLSDVFAATRFSDPLERLSFLISGMSSPEARLDAMRNFTEKAGYHIETNVPDTRLQEWGISRQQLNESLRPISKNGR